MPPKKKIFFIGLVLAATVIIGCSETQTDISSPQSLTIHPAGYSSFASTEFHGNQFKVSYNWSLNECRRCHSAAYSGGLTGQSCLGAGCHNTAKGPESCNTCHGVFADTTKIAPPRDLAGGFLYTSPGVGAHSSHLEGGSLGKAVECNWCHIVPTGLNSTGHLDAIRGAELVFDSIAVTKTGSLVPVPVYNSAARTCSNTYCHGYFKNGNNTNAPIWNGGAVACGSCHGSGNNPLPGGTHIQGSFAKNCQTCHSSVIIYTATSTDTSYTFKDVSKHINGVINY